MKLANGYEWARTETGEAAHVRRTRFSFWKRSLCGAPTVEAIRPGGRKLCARCIEVYMKRRGYL